MWLFGSGINLENFQSNMYLSILLGMMWVCLLAECGGQRFLTKDNMLKRNWQGILAATFVAKLKLLTTFYSLVRLPRVIWGVIAVCFYQTSRPSTYEQFWAWIGHSPWGDDVQMLGLAAVSWAIWKARNRICFDKCFDKKHINSPIEIIFSACAFMIYWAGLYHEATRKAIEAGVNMLQKTASQMIKKDPLKAAPVLMIKGVVPGDDPAA
jgi:hypothetical protein